MKKRFEFGRNWSRFLDVLDDERIGEAQKSLKLMLGVEDLKGKRFLDAGSGSGLFSLAAARLGASRVHSFDYDNESVKCTEEVRRRFMPDARDWTVERGDVLDGQYMSGLGRWDIVYSWGVLHHTGDMWKAVENVGSLVAENGLLYLSIYNDQGILSSYWKTVKVVYNRLPAPAKAVMTGFFLLFFAAEVFAADLLRLRDPFARFSGRGKRGMSFYTDVIDWIGGYPFEVARPEDIFRFVRQRGFILRELRTCGGKQGCNEFVFEKKA